MVLKPVCLSSQDEEIGEEEKERGVERKRECKVNARDDGGGEKGQMDRGREEEEQW